MEIKIFEEAGKSIDLFECIKDYPLHFLTIVDTKTNSEDYEWKVLGKGLYGLGQIERSNYKRKYTKPNIEATSLLIATNLDA